MSAATFSAKLGPWPAASRSSTSYSEIASFVVGTGWPRNRASQSPSPVLTAPATSQLRIAVSGAPNPAAATRYPG